MDPDTLVAIRDALKAIQRAEKLLEDYRPALREIAPIVATLGQLAQDHSRVALDLRIMRIRVQALLPSDAEHEDPEKTPVDRGRRVSAQLAAVKPPIGKLPGPGRPGGGGSGP